GSGDPHWRAGSGASGAFAKTRQCASAREHASVAADAAQGSREDLVCDGEYARGRTLAREPECRSLAPASRASASPGGGKSGGHRSRAQYLCFAVVADGEGRELERIDSPRPLRKLLPKLRRKSRALSRKQTGSRNRYRARQRLSRVHGRIRNIRHDFLHRHSTQLAQTQGHLVLEQLSICGLIRTRLARSIADSAWALFGTLLAYKAAWYGAELTLADRFYPSTRRCARCGVVGEALSLSERIFRCSSCGHEADRDTNAAACLAQYPRVVDASASASGTGPHVAVKQAETQNVCGEDSAGTRSVWSVRETVLYEAERTSVQRPRRAVLYEPVNML